MRRLLALVFVYPLLAAAEPEIRDEGQLYYENVPEPPARLADELRPYQQVRSAGFSGWLPDGGMLVRSRLAEVSQVFRIAGPGGRREQLTFFAEPVQDALPPRSADRHGMVMVKDVGGSEDYQLYLQDLGTGESELLTDGTSRNGAAVLSRAGDRVLYYSTRRNGRDWDLYVMDLDSGRERMVYEADGAWIPVEWSPDDDSAIVFNYISSTDSQPYLLDLETGETEIIAETEEISAFRAVRFGRSADEIFYVTDADGEYFSLYRLDRDSGGSEVIAAPEWNISDMDVSPDGSRLAYVVNEDGYGRLHVIDTASGEARALPDLPEGVLDEPRFSPDGRQLALDVSTPTIPGDVWSLDLESGESRRWTFSEVGGLSEAQFVRPGLVHYPTFDEVDGDPRRIPAWYYRPAGEGPFPVVVYIHGGPASQTRPSFSSTFQYWATEKNLAVVAPNVRGSNGYGKTYMSLDDGRKREDSVKDIGALLDWIAEHPELDGERVVVYGGSYGGYMVLASLMHYGERLAGGINVVGISNFVTFLENTRDYRRDLRRAEYGDERDPKMREFLQTISPANHPGKLDSPLFVIQGLNDPRVPASESEQVIEAVREAGGNPWYMLARNEGHGFGRKSNRARMYEAISLFLDEFLLKQE